MIELLATLSTIGLVLVISEILLQEKVLRGEVARKFVHILAGSFIASWAFFLDVRQIQILSAVLLCGVLVSKYLKIFRSVHGVTRKTWGEAFFAVSIGLCITLSSSPWVYAAAILHMSLADGLAAVIGTKFGRRNGYTVLGQYKTLIGTLTFFVTSVIITSGLVYYGNLVLSPHALLLVAGLPLATTVTENIAVAGFDNIAVPMVVIGILKLATMVY